MRISGLVWDASALINLGGSGRAEEILTACGCQSYVVREVRTQEVLYLRPLQPSEGDNLLPFDLTPLISAGRLNEIELSIGERETYVGYAREVDDGEAMTAAAAVHRGFCVATDDRQALRLLGSLSPSVPALTTLHWLQRWAIPSIPADEIGPVLRAIRIRANYRPPRRREDIADLCDWWDRHYPRED